MKRYELGCLLGEGSFGRVVSASLRKDPKKETAVKIVDFDKVPCSHDSLTLARDAFREAKILALLGNHTHCLRLVEVFFAQTKCFIVTERCEGTVQDWLCSASNIAGKTLLPVLHGMLLGLKHVHRCLIVHRDVKPSNFLLDRSFQVKICDFGFAQALSQSKSEQLLKGSYGTLPYMSPEMASGKGHHLNTDVWSLGATAYVMFYKKYLYNPCQVEDVRRAIICDLPKPRFNTLSLSDLEDLESLVESFVKTLLERNQKLRCTIEAALSLPLIRAFKATGTDCCWPFK